MDSSDRRPTPPRPASCGRATKPTVSVIVPTLPTEERAWLLARALCSALRQVRRPLEILVVQDGPALPSWLPILEREGVLAPPVRRIILSRHGGHVRARNTGLTLARGTHVAFLDDDDIWLPEHLADLIATARAGKASLVYSDAEVVTVRARASERPLVLERLPFAFDWDPDFLARYNFVIPSTLLYERSLHVTVGPLREAAGHHWDWDFLLRIAERGIRTARVPRVSVLYTVDAEGHNESARLEEMAASARLLTRRHGLQPVSGHNFRTMLSEPEVRARLRPTLRLWEASALPDPRACREAQSTAQRHEDPPSRIR